MTTIENESNENDIYGPYSEAQLKEWCFILHSAAKIIGRHGSERTGCILIVGGDKSIYLDKYYIKCQHLRIKRGDPKKLRLYQIAFIISRKFLPKNLTNIKKCISHLCGAKSSGCIAAHHMRIENISLNTSRLKNCHIPMKRNKKLQNLKKKKKKKKK